MGLEFDFLAILYACEQLLVPWSTFHLLLPKLE